MTPKELEIAEEIIKKKFKSYSGRNVIEALKVMISAVEEIKEKLNLNDEDLMPDGKSFIPEFDKLHDKYMNAFFNKNAS